MISPLKMELHLTGNTLITGRDPTLHQRLSLGQACIKKLRRKVWSNNLDELRLDSLDSIETTVPLMPENVLRFCLFCLVFRRGPQVGWHFFVSRFEWSLHISFYMSCLEYVYRRNACEGFLIFYGNLKCKNQLCKVGKLSIHIPSHNW